MSGRNGPFILRSTCLDDEAMRTKAELLLGFSGIGILL
jgi:hypothetical protein